MAAEYLPDRETLVSWLKDSDATINELTELFDDAMTAMSNLIDSHHVERLRSDRAHMMCVDALVQIQWVLHEYANDTDEGFWHIKEITHEVFGDDVLS